MLLSFFLSLMYSPLFIVVKIYFIGMATVLEFLWLILRRNSMTRYAITKVPRRANQTAHAATGATARRRPREMLMRARMRPRRPIFLWTNSQMTLPVDLEPSGCLWGRLKETCHKINILLNFCLCFSREIITLPFPILIPNECYQT